MSFAQYFCLGLIEIHEYKTVSSKHLLTISNVTAKIIPNYTEGN